MSNERDAPDVSILLPVYNAMPWLPFAVLSCLQQTGVRTELLAVDDGCTDGSAEFLLEVASLLAESRGVPAPAQKRPRTALPADIEALAAARRKLNPALQLPGRHLTTTNAAKLFIGGAAGDATAVAAATAAAAAVNDTGAAAVISDTPPTAGVVPAASAATSPTVLSTAPVAPAATAVTAPAAPTDASDANADVNGNVAASHAAPHAAAGAGPHVSGSLGAAVQLSAAEVVKRCRDGAGEIVVLHTGGRGQGAALNAALDAARAPYITEIEADDEVTPNRCAALLAALRTEPSWDGVVSNAGCIGCERPGMDRYVRWQSELTTPDAMREGRFIELPALRQCGMYRRSALHALRMPAAVGSSPGATGGVTGDDEGTAVRCLAGGCEGGAVGGVEGSAGLVQYETYRDLVEWPVDSDFWYRWYELGLVAGRLNGDPLYWWRQHAGQHTRTQGRCSLDNLRRCKVHFLLRPGGPAHGALMHACSTAVAACGAAAQVQVWSTARTLSSWANDLRAMGAADVLPVEWKPGAPMPMGWKRRGEQAQQVAAPGGQVIRLFAFGMEKARRKARESVRDWNSALDWFVA